MLDGGPKELLASLNRAFAPVEIESSAVTKACSKNKDRAGWCEVLIGGEQCHFGMVAEALATVESADWVHANIFKMITTLAKDDPSAESLLRAGQRAFALAHDKATQLASSGVRSGCSLTVCVVNRVRNELTTLSVGVTAAVFVGRDHVKQLTDDHRITTNTNEQERLRRLGRDTVYLAHQKDAYGRPAGLLRAWPGGYVCARALGDCGAPFMSAIPSYSTTKLSKQGGDVLICSDGVWNEMLVSGVASAARSCPTANTVARCVVDTAASAHMTYDQAGFGKPRDDVTCVVMRIARAKPLAKPEARPAFLQRGAWRPWPWRKAVSKKDNANHRGGATPEVFFTASTSPGDTHSHTPRLMGEQSPWLDHSTSSGSSGEGGEAEDRKSVV